MNELPKSLWMGVRHTHRGRVSGRPDPLGRGEVLAPRKSIGGVYRSLTTIITMIQGGVVGDVTMEEEPRSFESRERKCSVVAWPF